MARRPDPRQASIFDVLDAVPAGPVVRPGADPDWSARMLELIAEGLPPGAPAPFTEVLTARPGVRDGGGQISDVWGIVRMFDGAEHEFHAHWSPGHRVYFFQYPIGMQDPPRFDWRIAYPSFWWDGAAGMWVRGEPRIDHYGSGWAAHLPRGDFQGFLTGEPVDPRLRAVA